MSKKFEKPGNYYFLMTYKEFSDREFSGEEFSFGGLEAITKKDVQLFYEDLLATSKLSHKYTLRYVNQDDVPERIRTRYRSHAYHLYGMMHDLQENLTESNAISLGIDSIFFKVFTVFDRFTGLKQSLAEARKPDIKVYEACRKNMNDDCLAILKKIKEHGEINLGELAKKVNIDRHTITNNGHLTQLEEYGFIISLGSRKGFRITDDGTSFLSFVEISKSHMLTTGQLLDFVNLMTKKPPASQK